ncbi:hypothetical protein H6G00_01785 [Leptolyngbya sp. FACHB-541]|uniref:hypothetical protein n=1 Tax=Leptolyngbya sp. FACHB-541 TaxID=2692810 RepID=UPI001683CF42|nr:hypothetical protein [Leptolyngbya sp. FACHB-541]MBD1995362.1 hypothetical protein [Leptolyngbya sp. FACHB-541]
MEKVICISRDCALGVGVTLEGDRYVHVARRQPIPEGISYPPEGFACPLEGLTGLVLWRYWTDEERWYRAGAEATASFARRNQKATPTANGREPVSPYLQWFPYGCDPNEWDANQPLSKPHVPKAAQLPPQRPQPVRSLPPLEILPPNPNAAAQVEEQLTLPI